MCSRRARPGRLAQGLLSAGAQTTAPARRRRGARAGSPAAPPRGPPSTCRPSGRARRRAVVLQLQPSSAPPVKRIAARAAEGQQTLESSLRNRAHISVEGPPARMNRAIARPSSPIVVSLEQACHAGGHRSPKAPQIRPDIVGRWVIAPVHALLLLVLQTGNEPRVRDGYIGLSTRGHARARETRDKRPICRNNVIASDRPCPPVPHRNLHGKEGVDGSSPSEGFRLFPA